MHFNVSKLLSDSHDDTFCVQDNHRRRFRITRDLMKTRILPLILLLAIAPCARGGTAVSTAAFRLDLRPSPRAAWPSRTERLAWDVRWAEPGMTATMMRLALDGESFGTPEGASGESGWSPDHGGVFEFSLSSFGADGNPLGEVLHASFVAPEEAVLRRVTDTIRVDTEDAGDSVPVSFTHAVDPETGYHTMFTCTNLVEQAWVAAEDSRPTSTLLAQPNPASLDLGGWGGPVRFFTLVTSMYRSFKRGDRLE